MLRLDRNSVKALDDFGKDVVELQRGQDAKNPNRFFFLQFSLFSKKIRFRLLNDLMSFLDFLLCAIIYNTKLTRLGAIDNDTELGNVCVLLNHLGAGLVNMARHIFHLRNI
jgi:hypothetical protein